MVTCCWMCDIIRATGIENIAQSTKCLFRVRKVSMSFNRIWFFYNQVKKETAGCCQWSEASVWLLYQEKRVSRLVSWRFKECWAKFPAVWVRQELDFGLSWRKCFWKIHFQLSHKGAQKVNFDRSSFCNSGMASEPVFYECQTWTGMRDRNLDAF